MDEPALHPDLEPLGWLLGTWRGRGAGQYPTIDDFEYGEEARFWHVGRPVLLYAQRTWAPSNEAPMHSEMGYWRMADGGRVEVVLAHAFGIAEVEEGTVTGTRAELLSKTLTPTATAKHVDALARTFEVADDVLTYAVDMAYDGHELQRHLEGELKRIS